MSKIRDNHTNPGNAGKRLADSPAETHPFTRTVRLTIRATARFAQFLDENNENEIERELYWETSRFLCELKGLFKIGYQPSAELLTIMPELAQSLETLKAALTKHYRANKAKRVCAEIDRLINEVCSKCRFDDPLLLKDIWGYVCEFLRSLSLRSAPAPYDPSSPENITFYKRSYEALSANAELADKMREGIASGRISPALPSFPPCQTPTVVEIGKDSVQAIGKAVAKSIQPQLREDEHGSPKETIAGSKLNAALTKLRDIVVDACANSKDGVFLFTREDYVAVVNELWKHQTSSEYAVKRSEAATITELWYEIRTSLIKYAKSMIPKPVERIRDLSHRDCWQLFPKFTTVSEEPHVLDSTTLKELYVTLKISEKPRRTIKSKRPQSPVEGKEPQETVDIENLPFHDGRFAYTKDFKIVVDVEHTEPDYIGIDVYKDIPPSAGAIIKELIRNMNNTKTEGWCKSETEWHVSFQKRVARRFKKQQIQIQKQTDGRYYWRIIPDEAFHQHYICKLKPRSPSF